MDPSSSKSLETIEVALPLENRPNGSVLTPNDSDGILRYIDQILMEDDDLEPRIMLQESAEFRAKERCFYEALGEKYPPSPQQESSAMDNNNVPIQEFDDSVWMYTVDEKLAADMANMQILGNNVVQPGRGGAKIRAKERNKDEVVDLTALLTDCSKSVSSGDHLTTIDLLSRIRQHSSPYGDGNQRLAHYFANGLEARLAGTGGSQIRGIIETPDFLRAYRASQSSSPLRKITSFASNKMIVIKSEKATRIHIIDFGILYGIQWPSFIQLVAGREGGPPKKLRITGIEFPQVAEIIEDSGSRLARYAEMLGVPFEYKAIAQEWETIKVEDLKIEEDEFVAVVCSLRSMKLPDVAVGGAESPRAMFLELIREINPGIFIHSILNAAFKEPFFTYRFRELLLHFLALFDMLETFVPREKPERMMVERDVLGKEILNVIACEGTERVQRPETYWQWQARHLKAGFMKVHFERKLMDAILCKVNHSFHRDFLMFEKSQWLMMSWKGRALFAISCWQPAAA